MSAHASRRVLYIQYTNPGHYPPLEHSAHLLAHAGCQVLMLGVGAASDPMTLRPHARIDARLMPLESPGWRQKVHYARFLMWAAAEARAWGPDWIYASDPLSCPAALALTAVTGAELLYHEHDSPEPDAPPSSRFMKSVMAARRRVASHAALCVLPNAERADVFRDRTGARRVVTVWNTPLRSEVVDRSPGESGGLRLWYHGSVTPPNLPRAVLEAVARLPEVVSLDVVGYQTQGYAGYAGELRESAARLGLSKRFVVADAMPRAALIAAAARADVGVALLPAASHRINERAMVGASNKPFDYMAAGLALLVPDAAAWRTTFIENGLGVACDPESPDSIATGVGQLLARPDALSDMRRRAGQLIAGDWNYDTMFAPVMAAVLDGVNDTVEPRGGLMLAVIETHPIQYHAPLYRLLQQVHGIPVTAIYGSDFSTAGYRDAEFGASFAWDTDLLSGYTSVFLSTVAAGGASAADDATTDGLVQALKKLAPAAVLTVGYSPRFHRDGWLAAWRTGCPILFRGETNDEAVDRSWLKQMGRDAALRAVYRTCSRLLFVGRHARSHFERLGVSPDRLVFSPYCVDVGPFQTGEGDRAAHRTAARHEMGVSPGQVVLLFSGKLSRRKGVDLILEAARRLPADLQSRLVIAFLGDGALRGDLERLAANEPAVRAVFLGFQNQRQLSRYYHAADVLVLPSRQSETWGLVVNEALHHGVPCVVSDKVGSAPDLIDHGRTGYVFSTGSVYALAGALENAIDLCGREDVRHACRAKVAGYSTECAAAGLAEAYADAVGAGKAA